MKKYFKSLFVEHCSDDSSDRGLSCCSFDFNMPVYSSFFDNCNYNFIKEWMVYLSEVIEGKREELDWDIKMVIDFTSYKEITEVKVFRKIEPSIRTIDLYDLLVFHKNFLNYIRDKKTAINIVEQAFNKIVANPNDYPVINFLGNTQNQIPGRHSCYIDDICVTIQFNLERNEYNFTCKQFMAQVYKLKLNDNNPYWC